MYFQGWTFFSGIFVETLLLGFGLCSGAFAVSFREGNHRLKHALGWGTCDRSQECSIVVSGSPNRW